MLKILGIIFLLGYASCASDVEAADGVLGTTSSGSMSINLTIQNRVKITKIDDILFGSYLGINDLVGNDDMCVYRNGSNGSYNIKASSLNATLTDYRVKKGTDYIVYYVEWTDNGWAGTTSLVPDIALTGQRGSSNSQSCAGSTNATLTATLLEADLQGATTGFYEDTLTLLVAPE